MGKSKYKSPKSVARNQPVPIAVDDPRLAWNKRGQTKARQGAEVEEVGLDSKSLIAGGRNLNNATGGSGVDNNKYSPDIALPPINNQPPSFYPGGSGAYVILPTDPGTPTVTWSGEDLVVEFDWDYSNELNQTISQFILEVTADGITRRTPINTFLPNKTQNAQTLTLTKSLNRLTFGIFRTSITSVCVISADPFNNVSQSVCAATVPAYVLNLSTPVISITAISNGYSVGYTIPTQSSFDAIDIWEIENSGSTAPAIVYAADGVTPTNYKRTYFSNLSPANVITENYNKRWVIARFSSSGGSFTSFCLALATTPTSPVSVDLTPPNEVVSASAAWSGDNIVVSYQLPSSDPGIRVEIVLTSTNSLVGYFYRFPVGSGTNQTATITKRDLLEQFGQHYSSYAGVLKSIDSSDNRTGGVSFTVATRANPLTGIIPTFSLTPLTNGYSVFANNYASTTGVTYMEVYAKHTAWTTNPTNDDDVVYRGSNPAVIIDTVYTPVYVKVRYYDDFDNSSSYSNQSNNSITPIDSATVTSFENPITFGANGVIYAGPEYDSGKRTLFKSGGIFAYDASSTNGSTGLTTQIISDASAGTPTFITKRAQIADWNITESKIENTLAGIPTSYTGLSATGTYSFWAGSDTTGGDSSANFTVTPAGAVTARNISIIGNGNASSNLISAGGLFTVKNNGSVTATSANISGSLNVTGASTFTGNVKLDTGGSLYALGAGGTTSSGIRTIFNSSGVAAYNSSGGYAQMLTTPLADGSVFATTAANIGGWEVDSSKIQKTGISGKGNIILDSSNGYVAVSNSNITSSLAGINSPGNNLTHSVFWAGGTNPNDPANPFRVTLGGALYAQEAIISGTVTSTGALGTMKMDGDDGFISLATSSKSSYLIPRNGNIYLTSPSVSDPWTSSSDGKPIASSGPTTGPYFVAGSSFKDYWGTVVNGIGIYTGPWDYFSAANGTAANTASKPFISATDTGLQLSANAQVGIIVDRGGTATGNKLEPAIPNGTPGILLYTSKSTTAPYTPSTSYGPWAAFTPEKITLNASNSVVAISGTGVNQDVNGENWSAYDGASRIILDPVYGVIITGVQLQRSIDLNMWDANTVIPQIGVKYHPYNDPVNFVVGDGVTSVQTNGSYRNATPLGRHPRQRMMVEDPVTGEMMLGLGIYYKPVTAGTSAPGASTGYAGDFLVQY